MTGEQTKLRIAVVGLGNELMADDGVGVHAIRRLQGMLPADVPCIEIGTAALRAQVICEQADVVIAIDAVEAVGRPGSIYVFDIADAAGPRAESLHDLSLAGLIGLIPPDRRPRGIVVGIEPAQIEYGMALSEPVEAALPQVIRVVGAIVGMGGRIPLEAGAMAAVEEHS